MKILTEVTIPSFTTIVIVPFRLGGFIEEEYEIEVVVPESEHDVEIDLEELDFDILKQFVQDEMNCTLTDNDRLRFVDNFEQDFVELIECFDKHCLNKIKKQEIIQNIINQLDGTTNSKSNSGIRT